MIEENEYGTRQVQTYLLPIMKDIDVFCREHDVKYSLDGGNLIGAVRHKGFIPWDDDIDIVLDRENYEKLLKAAEKDLDEKYCLVHNIWVRRISRKDNPYLETEEGCIDLLVLDNVPDGAFMRGIKRFIIMLLQGMLKKDIDYSRYGTAGKILIGVTHVMGLPFSQTRKQKWYDKAAQIGNGKKTAYVGTFYSLFKDVKSVVFNSSVTEKYTDMDFEDCKFMCFAEYDHYLRALYGDYMQLPPEEERKPIHLKGNFDLEEEQK